MSIVIGTAGHIDHGKTTLLRALTGIDADRLPEERRRGMTIEVGYAHLALPDGDVLDFVDVPGHDRLVGNMLVGAGEIDAVLLVVAADDGPRAQTLEHLELLDALGLRLAVAAITKSDVAGGSRAAAIAVEVAALLARTAFAGAPVVPVSSITGDGLAALREALVGLRDRARADGAGAPGSRRLAVDRVFTVRGRGTVVTGTLRGGPLDRGAALRLEPRGLTVRAREMQVRGAGVAVAGPGRVALNVAGTERATIARGAVVTDDPDVVASARLLVALRPPVRLLPAGAAAAAPREWTPRPGAVIRLHLGTAQVDATIRRSRRDVDDLPGGEATALLRLAAPIAVGPGDRFVLRNAALGETAAGGRVVDPHPPTGAAWRRATPDAVRAMAGSGDREVRAAARLVLHGALPAGGPDGSSAAFGGGVVAGPLVVTRAIAAAVEAEIDEQLLGTATVSLAGVRPKLARVIRRHASVEPVLAFAAAGALVDRLVLGGRIGRTGDLLHAPGRVPEIDPAAAAAMDRLEAALDRSDPPPLAAAARDARCPPAGIRALEAAGRIVRVDDDLAWSAVAFARLRRVALGMASTAPLAPAALRDATGSSRRYVMALLEELGRRGDLLRTPAGHLPGPRAGNDDRPAG